LSTTQPRDEVCHGWSPGAQTPLSPHRFHNGYVYEGQWRQDVRHGPGRYTYGGTTYDGLWADGADVSHPLVCEPPFSSDKRHGEGILTVNDGAEVYRGRWQDGKMDGRCGPKPLVCGWGDAICARNPSLAHFWWRKRFGPCRREALHWLTPPPPSTLQLPRDGSTASRWSSTGRWR